MRMHGFGALPAVSSLTLGGGGIGMVWARPRTRNAWRRPGGGGRGDNTARPGAELRHGIAERVVGEAFGGALPAGVRVTSKCGLGDPPADQIEKILRQSIADSLARLKLRRLDVSFCTPMSRRTGTGCSNGPDAAARMTRHSTFVSHVRPVFSRLVEEGLIGAWGLTGIGHPDAIIALLNDRPAPGVVQCIANLLDSPGALKHFDGPAKPRRVMAAARANGVAVMGIRACRPAP